MMFHYQSGSFIFYSVTLLSSTRFAILVIIGSKNGLAINPIKKKPRPKSPNIINFVIKISGTIPPTTSRKQSIKYVNGKYGEMFWKNLGSVATGKVPPPPAICNTKRIMAKALHGLTSLDTNV